MLIYEAIKKANAGQSIRRKKWNDDIYIVPTDSDKCCIIFQGKKMLSSRWNPKREDLASDDWVLA